MLFNLLLFYSTCIQASAELEADITNINKIDIKIKGEDISDGTNELSDESHDKMGAKFDLLAHKLDKLEESVNTIYSKISSMLEAQCKNNVTTSPIPRKNTAPTSMSPVETSQIPEKNTSPTSMSPVTTSPKSPIIAASSTSPTDICPTGFFNVPESSDQCFKFFPNSALTWEASKSLCNAEGLQLAEPNDPATAVSLRKYLVETYAVGHAHKLTWLGARGTGTTINWVQNGEILSRNSSLWYPGQPENWAYATTHCLELLVREANMRKPYWLESHPTRPYYAAGCSDSKFPLCELLL